MRIGYDRLLTTKETVEELADNFLLADTDRVVIDLYTIKEVYPESSRLTRLLASCEAGDTLVIQTLERVSESPVVWRQLLLALSEQQLLLEVLASPSLTNDNWLEILTWWQAPATNNKQKSRIISVEKETVNESKKIRALAKNKNNRDLYWRVFKEIQQGSSLRQTAKRLAVSQGTVLRIKRDVVKLKQTIWLVLTFLITVASLKIAQAYADNWLLQILIGGVATIAIIYFSYSDMKELD